MIFSLDREKNIQVGCLRIFRVDKFGLKSALIREVLNSLFVSSNSDHHGLLSGNARCITTLQQNQQSYFYTSAFIFVLHPGNVLKVLAPAVQATTAQAPAVQPPVIDHYILR